MTLWFSSAFPPRPPRLRGEFCFPVGFRLCRVRERFAAVLTAPSRSRLGFESAPPHFYVAPVEGGAFARDGELRQHRGQFPDAHRFGEVCVHAGPEAQFTRAHALSWLGRGGEAARVLADIPAERLTEDDCARLTYLRASNVLWALGEPARAKEIIDGAPAVTAPSARNSMAAVNTVFWFATDQPAAALAASHEVVLDDLPAIVGAETAWTLVAIHADAGRTAEALAIADAGYALATRCSDAPQMRFNIAAAQVGALLLAGRIDEAGEIADRVMKESADLPGAVPFPFFRGRVPRNRRCGSGVL